MAATTYFVRLKPYNKRKGHLCRNYMTGGVRFTTRWKEVSGKRARLLTQLVQPHQPEDEIPLFDVVTREEALAIEEAERDKEGRPSSRVKEAERVADKSFREDKPQLDEESDEIVDPRLEDSDDEDEDAEDDEAPSGDDLEKREAEPSPPIRAKRKRGRPKKSD